MRVVCVLRCSGELVSGRKSSQRQGRTREEFGARALPVSHVATSRKRPSFRVWISTGHEVLIVRFLPGECQCRVFLRFSSFPRVVGERREEIDRGGK